MSGDVQEQTAKPSAGAIAVRVAWPAAFVLCVAIIAYALRTPAPAPTTVSIMPGATVVRELRALARLESLSLHVEKIVDVKDRQQRLGGMIEAQDSLLFVATGEVILGVDLGKLGPDDVQVDAKTGAVTLTLPAPEVLVSRLDEVHSYVHSRSTDLLAQRNEALEATARKEAVAMFEQAGTEPKNVQHARDLAEKEIIALAKAWGVTSLSVKWKGAPGRGMEQPRLN